MSIDFTTFKATIQTKLDAVTDPKEMLLLGKAIESTINNITVSDIQTEGATQVSAVQAAFNDADIAKYDDTTANFTGTLQNGGENVLVDTDIGSTVQAYDAGTAKLNTAQTWAANQNLADYLLQRPTLKDYAIEGSAIGNTGATQTFDLETANFFTATLDQASTFTFSNPPGSGDFGGFILALTNGGAFTITWPASVDWAGGNAPTLTASGLDILVFVTYDAGTTWHGVVSSLDSK